MKRFDLFAAAGGLIGALLSLGCQESWEADYRQISLVEVTGTVTMDGVALPHATVIFEGPGKMASSGVTDEHGRYRLMFDSIKSGVTPGTKTVRVMMDGGEDSEAAPAEGASLTKSRAIPPCYNELSQLRVTVDSNPQTVNLSLRSTGVNR